VTVRLGRPSGGGLAPERAVPTLTSPFSPSDFLSRSLSLFFFFLPGERSGSSRTRSLLRSLSLFFSFLCLWRSEERRTGRPLNTQKGIRCSGFTDFFSSGSGFPRERLVFYISHQPPRRRSPLFGRRAAVGSTPLASPASQNKTT